MLIDLLYAIGGFILAIGVLVTFHEFGHYLAARCCGVKILRFSIGFGRPLWRFRYGADRTEWVVAAVPLGGYVKMLDSGEQNMSIPEDELERAFDHRPLWQRALIVVAGPAFNFLFALMAWWCVFMAGEIGFKPHVAEPPAASAAAQAGLREGDTIRAVGEIETPTMAALADALLPHLINREDAVLHVADAQGRERRLRLPMIVHFDDLPKDVHPLHSMGIKLLWPKTPAEVNRVELGSAAEVAGLLSGDRIVAVDGAETAEWKDLREIILLAPGKPLDLRVERGRELLELTLIPKSRRVEETGELRGYAGIEAVARLPERGEHSWSLTGAFVQAGREVQDKTVLTLQILWRMVVGDVSVKNLSGPVAIADYAGKTVQVGWIAFLAFLAIISLNLGIINLMPIPLLDGGHLLLMSGEALKGKPLSEKTQLFAQRLGMVLIYVLLCQVLYNDAVRLLS
ncbi:MAG: RIP metalloprotease RseP [Candidatus Eutrophobiaceae bacterium]